MHSPDGRWWWDGQGWLPAWSADGRYWFDGVRWQQRPPRRDRTWWIVLGGVAVGLVALVAVIASLVVYARVSGEAHDAFSLDDELIRQAASAGCADVEQTIEHAVGSRVDRVGEGNMAIGRLVDSVDSLGRQRLADDRPALDWLDDWRHLATARAELADDLAAGRTDAVLHVPSVDGVPITGRMADVAPEPCAAAVNLAGHP